MRQIHRRQRHQHCLTFAPQAWLKLQWFCHAGDTEVGGFGFTAPNRPLYVTDFLTLPQEATSVSVRFPDDAVADFFDSCADQGLTPDRFARVWLHTHPGRSARPSGTDEATFRGSFGSCDWSVMAIVSREGRRYARLHLATGPGANIRLGFSVDWASWPEALNQQAAVPESQVDGWMAEYLAHVHMPPPLPQVALDALVDPRDPAGQWWDEVNGQTNDRLELSPKRRTYVRSSGP